MNLREKKGSISIFVLVMLFFMSAFLIISYAANVNKSKTVKEQFNIISKIYSYNDGDEGAYDKAYTDLRNKNKQKMQASSETDTLELTKTFNENLSNYRIYGNSIQRLLPDEYQQVEYIESTGTQYIELDYIASNVTNSKGKYQITNTTKAAFLFGSRGSSGHLFYGLNWGGGVPYKYYNSYYSGKITTLETDVKIHTFYKNKGSLYIDDILISSIEAIDFTTPYKMNIFACNDNGNAGYLSPYARIYYLQFYDNDELKANLIPCYRKSDNAIGMYDLVENKFYTNKGTGTFVKGVDITTETPTPDTPIEIKSVGDKTSNLVDLSKVTASISTSHTKFSYDNSTGTLELTSTPTTYDYSLISASDLGLEAGKTYYYGGTIEVTGKQTTNGTEVVFSLNSHAHKQHSFTSNGTKVINETFTYTGQDSVNFRLFFNYGSKEKAKVTFRNIYVSEIKPEFEPYNKYKIPVKTNINLENITFKTGYYIDANNNVVPSTAYKYTNEYISVLPNTEYKLIFDEGTENDVYITIPFYDKDKNFITRLAGLGTFMTLPKIVTFITPEDCYFIRFSMPIHNYTIEFSKVTNIYLDEPLRKVGKYADYIDFQKKAVVRNIKEQNISDFTWYVTGTGENQTMIYYCLLSEQTVRVSPHKPLSNIMFSSSTINTGDKNIGIAIYNYKIVRVRPNLEKYPTLDDWKAYLANNTMLIYYALEAPTEEQIDLPNISTYEDYTKIEVLTELDPSKIEVEYIGYTLE